jgi:UDP-N-acetylglucosamine 1-carboxyvinyltransferase
LVHGGRPLRGTVRPAGNKNAALPILAATLLADGPVDLENIPRIRDVETMLALLVDLGATAEWTGSGPRSCWPAPCWPDSAV